ncbi:MSHA biogenesis protein MshK [Shewanella litorisediminis]|uniref:MSHA biogenesis protein MshK n=1 Tax=Shewanella litorisediminis TaxID=1173586 RepID=A0ABX7G4S9_9GAMM|nr:MSHA biogenesis protein MshK [Shewanella litorisediminis]MCL2917811.1 MSHA biogenesis protein MshK [Shewanella litorisediminis]QRH02253.1 MSHA biogenesis protein MshK [Shewanella litorisediminis]
MWRISSLLLCLCGASQAAEPLRDPTQPADFRAQAVGQAQGSRLTSIINSPDAKYAVIGNRLLTLGDSIGNARITAIGSDYVSLSDGKTLRLFQAITER